MIHWVVIFHARIGSGSFDRGVRWSDWPSSALPPHPTQTPLLRRRQLRADQELGQAQQLVTAHRQGGQEGHLILADHLHLAHRPPVLAPPEALLDPLADSLAHQVTDVPRGAGVYNCA